MQSRMGPARSARAAWVRGKRRKMVRRHGSFVFPVRSDRGTRAGRVSASKVARLAGGDGRAGSVCGCCDTRTPTSIRKKSERSSPNYVGFAQEVYDQDGITVEEMVAICLRYHTDSREADSDWIVELDSRKAKFVRRRLLKDLVNLCRLSGLDLKAA